MIELSALQTTAISLVGTIVSLLVGFAILDSTTAGIVVSAAGTLVSIAFQIVTELQRKTKVQAAVAVSDVAKLRAIANR
jgi:hypothetical protein